MGSYVNSIMMSIDMYASSALGRCEFQVRGRDNRSDVVHYFNKWIGITGNGRTAFPPFAPLPNNCPYTIQFLGVVSRLDCSNTLKKEHTT